MDQILEVATLRAMAGDAWTQLSLWLWQSLPRGLGAVGLLAAGYVLGVGLSRAVRVVVRRLGVDRWSSRIPVRATLERAGIETEPSVLAGRFVFWVIVLLLGLWSLELLGVAAARRTLDRLAAYMPAIVTAALIMGLGTLIARLVRNVVGSAAAASGLPQAERLGRLGGYLALVIFGLLAARELGIDANIVVALMAVAISAVTLSFGVAFALGAGPVVRHILAGHFLRQSLRAGSTITVEGQRGLIEEIGAVDTRLRSDEQCWTVPNARLLEQIVIR